MIQKQRKGNGVLKLLAAVVLSAVVGMSNFPGMSMVSTVHAEGVKTITGLGTGAIQNPTPGAGGWSKVYFGSKASPILFNVLKVGETNFGGKTMLLDCASILEARKFNLDSNSNAWAQSYIKTWLNNDFLKERFTDKEQTAIVESSKDGKKTGDGDGGGDKYDYAALTDERVFLLDAVEATNKSYGFENNANSSVARKKTGEDSEWWLRSPDSNSKYAGYISEDGGIGCQIVDDDTTGVSPAFNVNLSSVIFSSLLSGTAGSADAEYKLTLKDTGLGVNPGIITGKGKTVTVSYSGVTGDPKQLSVVMTNGTWSDSGWSEGAEKKYYGKLNIKGSIGTSGSGTFDLPEGFSLSKGWKAYLIAEKVNGEKETDYAGTPAAFTIPKLDPVAAIVTANNRTYDGTEKPLVNVDNSTLVGGTMYYALGENATTASADNLYTTTIPKKTDAGTYYVWYKVKGDDNHTDTEPVCVKVTIGDTPQPPASEEETTQPEPVNDKHKNTLRINAGLKFTQSGSKITAKWGKVQEASMYEVYGAYCEKKMKLQKTVNGGKKTKTTIKKLNGKKLNLRKSYKFYVVAYKNENGKKIKLAKSLIVHIAGRKSTTNTNVKAIKLNKKSYTLKKGRTAKIKARLVLVNKKKKALSKKHGARFRYASSNKAVAAVTKGGKIKAGKPGNCTVYVYAINGCSKKIKVTVR